MKADLRPYRSATGGWRRSGKAWLGAASGALVINLALFALMPRLLQRSSEVPVFEQPVANINVIRLKEETRELRDQEKPPPPPPEALPQPRLAAPSHTRFALDFELNPRLPAGPVAVALPAVAPVVPDMAGLGEFFAAGDLDAPLTVISRIPPVYPPHAKHRGVKGWVQVRFVVREDGRVTDIAIQESQPAGVFDASVVRSVAGWRFKPGTVAGTPVKAWAETTIRFELE
ncbi:MAG TPA: energy transducer TonB [Desulfobacterales bacterium]|jgi:periplasmic protein TonB|nr:energy transducer TonB [Desulfobacterales bacterium]